MAVSRAELILVKGPDACVPRYRLYPAIEEEALAVQDKSTWWATGVVSETEVLATLLGLAVLWAVTITAALGTAAGAVYRPVAEIVPSAGVPPTVFDTSQFTPLLLAPVTLALNCSDCPTCKLGLVGERETDTVGVVRVTMAVAFAVDCARLCAVTVRATEGTAAGAE